MSAKWDESLPAAAAAARLALFSPLASVSFFLFLCLVLEAHCGRTYDKDGFVL